MLKPKEYYCRDCRCKFVIHSIHKSGKKVSCPLCSDSIGIEHLVQNRNKAWTDEEVRYIDKLLRKQMSIYEVMALTNRTYNSVDQKARRSKI